MDLTLTYCWKEWRAQRDLLLAYTLLGLLSLCLVFVMVPEEWWLEDGQRALALSWFVGLGGIGVIAFIAPGLVRNEQGHQRDQFVRRLPGALWPSFTGKLLFLLLAVLALPLLCLLVGEGFLLAIGQPWHDLFAWHWSGEVSFVVPWTMPPLGYTALLIPWVWAVGTWMPAGRLALGGTAVFVLLLAVAVYGVLRQCPQIVKQLAWQEWLWLVPALGLVVACVSWTRGRRGGGARRSARVGLAAAALGLATPAGWLGERAWRYHHPDPGQLATLAVGGLSPEGRYVLAHGAADFDFLPVSLRIDLRDGAATQIGGAFTWFLPGPMGMGSLWSPAQRRYWRVAPWGGEPVDGRGEMFDLVTLERRSFAWSERLHRASEPMPWAKELDDEQCAGSTLRAPGGLRVWWRDGELCFETPAGGVERMAWPTESAGQCKPAGHGMFVFGGSAMQWFDFTTRQVLAQPPGTVSTRFVRGAIVYHEMFGKAVTWSRRLPGQAAECIDALRGANVLGLVDDDWLLCTRAAEPGRPFSRLFLWHVHAGLVRELELPTAMQGVSVQAALPIGGHGSLLPRDPAGRIWLAMCNTTTRPFAVLDVASGRVAVVPAPLTSTSGRQLIGWPDAQSALIGVDASIQRIDLATGAATQLFPPSR